MATTRTAASDIPASRRRGPTKGDLKERAILDTAWKLMGSTPIDQITIDDLAKGAGISRSSFYFYFESKQAVVAAVAQILARQTEERMGAMVGPDGGLALDGVALAVRRYFDDWRANGQIYKATGLLNDGDPALREFWQATEMPLIEKVAAAVDRERAAGRAAPLAMSSLDTVWMMYQLMWRVGHQIHTTAADDAEVERAVQNVMTVIVRTVWNDTSGTLATPAPDAAS